MKKAFIIFTFLVSLILTGCLKDNPNVDFSKISAFVELPYSGRNYFTNDALNFTSDTITVNFTVNLASNYTLDHDITVNVGVDKSLVATYNTIDTSVRYKEMPDSAFSFQAATLTIKAGKRLDTLHVTFYHPVLDPTLSYMLPIKIVSISDPKVGVSGNFGVHYFHAIGNPIAGTYNHQWIRFNTLDTSGTPAYNQNLGAKTFSPLSPTTVAAISGSAGLKYLLSFKNTGGSLSNFAVSFDATSVANSGVTITSGPVIEVADPVKGIYRFEYTYNNSAGAARTIIDQYVK